jgi:hypothetical protein
VTADWQAADSLYLSFGWRHLYRECEEGGSACEDAMSGPLAGVTWRL